MHRRRIFAALVAIGVLIVVTTAVALLVVQPAQAQCGSQASSCKNCHETQGKKPVNNDGTAWHQSHAFGDFCYICHFGNNQATDEVAAHAGMVSPLADVKASCAQCHPNDLQARAQVYAVKLGIQIGAVASPAASAATSAAPGAASTTAQPAASPNVAPASPASAAAPETAAFAPSGAPLADANLTDYVTRYNQQVLNQQPTNWGNVILWGLVILLLLGGALFVNRREGWLSVSFTEKKPLDKDFPTDVADMAAQIAHLSPASRKSLAHLLDRPEATSALLSALDRLSTDESSGDKH